VIVENGDVTQFNGVNRGEYFYVLDIHDTESKEVKIQFGKYRMQETIKVKCRQPRINVISNQIDGSEIVAGRLPDFSLVDWSGADVRLPKNPEMLALKKAGPANIQLF